MSGSDPALKYISPPDGLPLTRTWLNTQPLVQVPSIKIPDLMERDKLVVVAWEKSQVKAPGTAFPNKILAIPRYMDSKDIHGELIERYSQGFSSIKIR